MKLKAQYYSPTGLPMRLVSACRCLPNKLSAAMCNRCLNPAHIELGDQAQNFIDLKAAQAYGIRWELLPKAPLETLR